MFLLFNFVFIQKLNIEIFASYFFNSLIMDHINAVIELFKLCGRLCEYWYESENLITKITYFFSNMFLFIIKYNITISLAIVLFVIIIFYVLGFFINIIGKSLLKHNTKKY